MKAEITPQQAINRKGWKVLFLAMLALAGTFVLQVVGLITTLFLRLPEESLAFTTIAQSLAAGSALLGMLVLGGVAWLKPSRADVRDALRTGWPILAADAVLLVITTASFFAEGATVTPDWLPNLALTAFLCLCIGIAEEVLYRGIILNAILAVMGRSHRGTMGAIAIVSVLFGFAHVSIDTDFATPLLAAQAVLKIIQTGLFSVILCGIVLRTHRLGGAALFHGLSDFLLMVPTLVLVGEQLSTSYVSTGEEGITAIVVYLATIALYLPFAISAIRRMRRERTTYRGVFMEHAPTAHDDEGPSAQAALPSAA